MPTLNDPLNLAENVFFKDLYRDAIAEGKTEAQRAFLLKLLESKFSPLPEWAELRIQNATAVELERWRDLFLSSTTIEKALA